MEAYTQMPQSLAQRASGNRRTNALDAKRSAGAKPVLANGIPWEAGVRSRQGHCAECQDCYENLGDFYCSSLNIFEAFWHHFRRQL